MGIWQAYKTGKGRVILRGRVEVETLHHDREQLVITEIPYMVNKSGLLEKMADLVRLKTIEGISCIRDESDRSGMRIVVGIKKDNFTDVILNKLYKYTNLQTTFGINNLALVDMHPRLLALKDIIQLFIDHRHTVVERRTQFELKKARERSHILEGLRIAIDNIDEIVTLIKTSSSTEEAMHKLQQQFELSEIQSKAILEMRLQRLTGLEREKIEEEYATLIKRIETLKEILEKRELRMNIIKEELLEIKKKFKDVRKTEIVEDTGDVDIDIEDMIADEDVVITMTHAGYIKRCPLHTYRSQGRGGRGVKGMDSKDDDFVETLFITSTHSYLLFFTNTGRCYWLKVYKIPEAGRYSRGRPIVNLLQLRSDEEVASFVPVKEFDENHFIIAITRNGVINKQPLKAYSNVRRDGINAINLDDGDGVIECKLTDGSNDIIIGTKSGMAVRFHESVIRELGRNTRGVRGITLRNADIVIGMIIVDESNIVLSVTENGYGKRTAVTEYRRTNRGGIGIKNIKTTKRNGSVVGIKRIGDDHDVMIITRNGIIIRCDGSKISLIGRNTQGVRLMNLEAGDSVIDVGLCEREEGQITDEGEEDTIEKG
jgi:DNA gyrase subunit A